MATMEEKAKRYDEAIKVAKDIRNGEATYIPDGTPVIEALFPELAESEDERIREDLLAWLKDKQANPSIGFSAIKMEQWIVWLEKQGENNSNKMPIVWKHWKDGICGNGEGKPIYLIKNGDAYSISPVLGYECDYIELSDLDKFISAKDTKNPAWGEEDEKIYHRICGIVHDAAFANYDVDEIGEEDETGWTNTMIMIKEAASNHYTKDSIKLVINWLQSIKQRIGWEPSEEQMSALDSILQYHQVSAPCYQHVLSLYNDLKKLKE